MKTAGGLNYVEHISLTLSIKEKVKKTPIVYNLCRFVLNPGIRLFPLKRKNILRKIIISGKEKILNIGSGYLLLPGAVNIDIHSYAGIHIACDAHNLSFASKRFDAVILESILEHVENPINVINESYRVLKKGGIILVEFPFLYEFHNAPSDYHRFTMSGMELLLKDFTKIDSGISVGPTGVLNMILRNHLAILLSFNNVAVYEFLNMFLGVFLFPLKLIDLFFIVNKNAINSASLLYFIGKK